MQILVDVVVAVHRKFYFAHMAVVASLIALIIYKRSNGKTCPP